MSQLSAWRAFLAGREPRERRALAVAALVLAGYALWQWGVAPAWRTLQAAPAQRQLAEGQWQSVQALAAEAQQLRAQAGGARLNRQATLRALEAATQATLGRAATLAPAGDSVSVTLQGVAAAPLAQWLAQVRVDARLRPLDLRLERVVGQTDPRWQGTVVLGGAGLEQP